jgi:hypothetical protein
MSSVTTNVDLVKEDPQVISSLTYVKCLKNVTHLELKPIDRFNLYNVMEEFQIPKELIALVKATMSNTLCQIRIQNLLSDHIYIKMMSGKEMPWPACCLI